MTSTPHKKKKKQCFLTMAIKELDLFTTIYFIFVNTRLALLWFHCISGCVVRVTGVLRGIEVCDTSTLVYSVQGASRIGTAGLETKCRLVFGQTNVSNSGTLRRQKAASAWLLSVRPVMPRFGFSAVIWWLRPAFKIVYTASHETHRFVNIYHVGQCYPVLMFGTRSPAGFHF